MATSPPLTNSSVGDDGKVRIYDLPAREWRRVPFVDAKEMLNIGSASMHGPEIEMIGPAGRIRVHQTEVDEKTAEGYRLAKPEDPDVRKALKTREEAGKVEPRLKMPKSDAGPTAAAVDFNKFNIGELRRMAADAKIEGADSMTKQQITEALDAAGFDPKA